MRQFPPGFEALGVALICVALVWLGLSRTVGQMDEGQHGYISRLLARWRSRSDRVRSSISVGLTVFGIGAVTLLLLWQESSASSPAQVYIALAAITFGAVQIGYAMTISE